MTSLRRKLSLTWKRDKTKGSNASSNETGEKSTQTAHPQLPTRQDSMPPPRIPVSATVNSLSNIKQTDTAMSKTNGGYLESRRRKSSAASLGAYSSHDRTKIDTWSGKKDTPDVSTMPTARHTSVMNKLLKPKSSASTVASLDSWSAELDKDDLGAEEEMRKMGSRRKETEIAARTIDTLRKRATRKERVGPHEAIRVAMLNIYERGEIVDYPDIYFCGTQGAAKVVGDLNSDAPNFGYDDDRGDYTIVPGDHLSFRYEIVDILGKGSFGQVVRCIDHKLGVLVAVKIIRNKKRFHQQALVEVDILQKLREWVSPTYHIRAHTC
jgi:dual specificity tyrosine-phosphorylation-regulated kinase 2/3/4